MHSCNNRHATLLKLITGSAAEGRGMSYYTNVRLRYRSDESVAPKQLLAAARTYLKRETTSSAT
jgi:hypothetical protein